MQFRKSKLVILTLLLTFLALSSVAFSQVTVLPVVKNLDILVSSTGTENEIKMIYKVGQERTPWHMYDASGKEVDSLKATGATSQGKLGYIKNGKRIVDVYWEKGDIIIKSGKKANVRIDVDTQRGVETINANGRIMTATDEYEDRYESRYVTVTRPRNNVNAALVRFPA